MCSLSDCFSDNFNSISTYLGAGKLPVPGRPTTLAYGRAGACSACSSCGMGGLVGEDA